MAERRKLLVIVTGGVADDKTTIAFTLANASLSAGLDVGVFLTSNGVDVARAGAADLAQIRPFKPLSELVEAFVRGGGKLLACGSCWQHRGLADAATADGASISGMASVVEWIAAGATTVTL